MRYLCDAGYRVMPLRDLVQAATSNDLDSRSVALTFDDGYLDSLTNAAPILAEFEFPSTFFVVGAALDEPYEFWWDGLERVFFSGYPVPERLSVHLPSGVLDAQLRTVRNVLALIVVSSRKFYHLDHGERVEALRVIADWRADSGSARPLLHARAMTAGEVRRLATLPGVSIGAHSAHHLSLPVLSLEQQRLEIETCKDRLEALVGCHMECFSYPYGAHDAETERLVRLAGFKVGGDDSRAARQSGCRSILRYFASASGAEAPHSPVVSRRSSPRVIPRCTCALPRIYSLWRRRQIARSGAVIFQLCDA